MLWISGELDLKRAYSIILIVSLCIVWCSGCIYNATVKPVSSIEDRMLAAEVSLKDKKYAEALESYRSVFTEATASESAAEAKFGMAYTLIFYDNPQKNFSLAFQEFDEFLKLYPGHSRSAEAQTWRNLLKQLLDARRENERFKKNIEQLKKIDIRHEEQRSR